jgi:hypothetical protein
MARLYAIGAEQLCERLDESRNVRRTTGPDDEVHHCGEAKLQDLPAGVDNTMGPGPTLWPLNHDRPPRFFEDVPEKATEDEEGPRHR